MLREPNLTNQEPIHGLQEMVQLLFGAVGGDGDGVAAVQGKHAHQAAGIHMVVLSACGDGKTLCGSQVHKGLHILK
mgnify:CR=1 FL=1